MSGHSKWATIKRKKQVTDKKRGQLFSKLSRSITIAAKNGGDPETNPALRLEMDRAKEAGMTNDTIDRAIKKGTGEDKDGSEIEEITYEAYGPGGVAMMIHAATDNRNRTSASVKHLLNKYEGSLGQQGSVSYLFEQKGLILIPKDDANLDELSLQAIDFGAEDVVSSEHGLEVYTNPQSLHKIKTSLENSGANIESFETVMTAKSSVELNESQENQLDKLIEALEDDEDVMSVHTNIK